MTIQMAVDQWRLWDSAWVGSHFEVFGSIWHCRLFRNSMWDFVIFHFSAGSLHGQCARSLIRATLTPGWLPSLLQNRYPPNLPNLLLYKKMLLILQKMSCCWYIMKVIPKYFIQLILSQVIIQVRWTAMWAMNILNQFGGFGGVWIWRLSRW